MDKVSLIKCRMEKLATVGTNTASRVLKARSPSGLIAGNVSAPKAGRSIPIVGKPSGMVVGKTVPKATQTAGEKVVTTNANKTA